MASNGVIAEILARLEKLESQQMATSETILGLAFKVECLEEKLKGGVPRKEIKTDRETGRP